MTLVLRGPEGTKKQRNKEDKELKVMGCLMRVKKSRGGRRIRS
jgi:hypothetical protein